MPDYNNRDREHRPLVAFTLLILGFGAILAFLMGTTEAYVVSEDQVGLYEKTYIRPWKDTTRTIAEPGIQATKRNKKATPCPVVDLNQEIEFTLVYDSEGFRGGGLFGIKKRKAVTVQGKAKVELNRRAVEAVLIAEGVEGLQEMIEGQLRDSLENQRDLAESELNNLLDSARSDAEFKWGYEAGKKLTDLGSLFSEVFVHPFEWRLQDGVGAIETVSQVYRSAEKAEGWTMQQLSANLPTALALGVLLRVFVLLIFLGFGEAMLGIGGIFAAFGSCSM